MQQYLRRVKSFILIKGRTERRFLSNLRNDLEEFDKIHPDSSYETLTEEFGSPWDMFYSYLSEQNSGLLVRRVKLRKAALRVFIGVLFAIVLSLILYTADLINEYNITMENVVDGYRETVEILE